MHDALSYRLLLPAAALACAGFAHAVAAQEPYHPQPVAVPVGQSYVLADGSVAIVGNDGLEHVVRELNALFIKTHPGIRFSLRMEGSSTGMPALIAGATIFAPVTRDMWPGDRSAFRQVFGYDATPIQIGYNGHGPRPPNKTPPAVYVHADNPLEGLSIEQLSQVFTAGTLRGDINTWSQLGLKGEYAQRRIHAYGLRDDGGFATGIRLARFGGRPFAIKYEALPNREAVLRAVMADPFGIAFLGWVDASKTTKQVRVLPLAAETGGAFHSPSYEEVRRGEYPLSMPVQLYVNRPPGQPLDPVIREYLRLALSKEGQDILARQRDTEEGYVPLSAEDLEKQLAKLRAM